MEAFVRIFYPLAASRCLLFTKNPTSRKLHVSTTQYPFARLQSSSFPQSLTSSSTTNQFNLHISHSNPSGCIWSRAPVLREKRSVVTVVLLGWLGSKTKHLKRYVEWYNSRGFHVVTFVVDVREALWFDLGNRAEQRVRALADEMAKWVLEDGNDRCLIFHTFCNTGWLAYGAILDKFQGRHDIMDKIRGCIVDSGAGDPFNPQIFAAGFSIALLKHCNVAAETREPKELQMEVKKKNMQDKKPWVFETVLLFVLEKFFSLILRVPDVDRRLTRSVSILSKKQPDCPQLYLYSSADKVIPFRSVEWRMEEQRSLGIRVHSFNFVSSTHVEHFRSFPDTYSSLLHNFLEDCQCLPIVEETPTVISSP